MLKFKVLENDCDLFEFSQNYEAAFANKDTTFYKLPVRKLRTRDKVVGIFKKGQMVGGYSISDTPNTLINNIKPENKAVMSSDYPLDSCYDLANIWRTDISKFQFSAIVWPRIVLDTMFFNLHKPNIVGYALTGHGRLSAYDKASPFYIQSSEVKNELNIFVFSRMNLAKAFLIGVKNEISKALFFPFSKNRPAQLNEVKR